MAVEEGVGITVTVGVTVVVGMKKDEARVVGVGVAVSANGRIAGAVREALGGQSDGNEQS